MNNFIQILHIASNQFLDLFEDTEINLELVNDLLAEELNSETFSYQFKIPSTENNEKLFSFPTIPQVQNSLNEHVPVTLFLGGVPYKSGKLVNVNNVGDSIDNYMEFGFVGDKANIDLTKNIRNVFDSVDDIEIEHWLSSCGLARFDAKHLTTEELNAIAQSYCGLDARYGFLFRYSVTILKSTGTSWTIASDDAVTFNSLKVFVDKINTVLAAENVVAKLMWNYTTDENLYYMDAGGGHYTGYVNTNDYFGNPVNGTILLKPIDPENNVTYKFTAAFRRLNIQIVDNDSGFVETFYNQTVPFYNYDYRTLKSGYHTNLLSSGYIVFPTLKALYVKDDLSTVTDEKWDAYGGENNLFPKSGDKYDPTKSYPRHIDTGLERHPVYVFYGDPAILYRTTVTDVANPGETPISTPSKWVKITDEQQENYINSWSNSGTRLDFDNRIYVKNQFSNTIIPCIYLYKVIQQIFIDANIELIGEVINDEEFQKLIIVFNKTLDSSISTTSPRTTPQERKLPTPPETYYWNNYQTSIHLGDHLPDMSISDFLNALRNYFGIGFIFKEKTCEMVFMQTILSNNTYKDFTSKTVRGVQLVKEEYWGIQFTSERDSGDRYYDVADMTDYTRVLDLSYDATEDKAKKITTPISPLLMGDANDGYGAGSGSTYQMPVMGNKLSSESYGTEESCNLRLLIYHGKTVTPLYADYATQNQFEPNRSTVLTTLKLDWTKLEELYWYDWERFVEGQKTLKYRFIPSLMDILTFDFKEKIRVRDQNFMVKRVQIPIKMTGIDEIQKELYIVK